MKRLFSMMIFAILLTTQTAFCTETEQPASTSQIEKFRFILPIDWTTPYKYDLVVSIPEGFRSLQSIEDMLKESTSLIEFIPKDEEDDSWTQIITVNRFIGKKITAEYFSNFLKNSMLAKVSNGKVWLDTATDHAAYHQTTLGLTYDFLGKHEVMGAQYYSGPYDCAGVQYTIRPGSTLSDKQAIEKIKDYFKTGLEVIKAPEPTPASPEK